MAGKMGNENKSQPSESIWSRMMQQHDGNVARWRDYPIVGSVVKAGEATVATVKGTASFVDWLNQNWRIAIIGLVAIVILLKD